MTVMCHFTHGFAEKFRNSSNLPRLTFLYELPSKGQSIFRLLRTSPWLPVAQPLAYRWANEQTCAQNVVFLKRSMRPGFAGVDNELYFDPKCMMLFGDAKESLNKLFAALKA